ncbi:LGFP repeat-containing protein [Mycobacterium sp.]|uniref:LGFP repeat-containing protein n=1 Tax=Mycobacterium sp. TaxID=1785 RepID=UPI003F9CB7C5
MRAITKRTVAFTAAIAGFALIGSGCHANKSYEATSSSTTSAMSSSMMSSSATSSAAAGPTSTQIPGANGTPYTVQGPILAKYQSLTDAQLKDLGKPYDNELKTKDGSGSYQQFDGGVLIYRTGSPVYFVWGKIRDAWNAVQASQGKLGYPTSDEQILPDGSFKSVFEHGTITWKTGDPEATVTMS